jgi:hypothetical protein
VTYTTAAGKWRRTEYVCVVSTLDTPLATFPIPFLTTCGDNTWSYVIYAVSLVVDNDPLHPATLVDSNGQALTPEGIPSPGNYRYIENGPLTLTSRRPADTQMTFPCR